MIACARPLVYATAMCSLSCSLLGVVAEPESESPLTNCVQDSAEDVLSALQLPAKEHWTPVAPCKGISCPDLHTTESSGPIAALEVNLPVDDTLVAMNSSRGAELLQEALPHSPAYFQLMPQFALQVTQTFCGVATAVSQLNALPVDAPVDPDYKPYPYFTQSFFFNNTCVTDVVAEDSVRSRGMTLEQFSTAVPCYGASTVFRHANASSARCFRKSARRALQQGQQVAVNFNRQGINQLGGGHFSPLSAYAPSEDRFLLLDVAKYKYPPVWVKTEALFEAMDTMDTDAGKSRGWAVISACGNGAEATTTEGDSSSC